jgi:heme/copper-type cytochrome/quinol oxidase subunit 2
MIKFECCHCTQPIEAPDEMYGMEVDCPGCHKKVRVRQMVETPVIVQPSMAERLAERLAEKQKAEAEKIEQQAMVFTGWSVFFIVIGVAALLFWLFFTCVIGTDDSGERTCRLVCLLVVGGSFGLAFWFYLVAQVIHIRALLAKK